MTGAKRWMIWILPDTDWQAWRSQPGTLQNLGRDDLEVFSTIKDPFGLETKSVALSGCNHPAPLFALSMSRLALE